MKVIRDPQIISGFVYERPVDELPELTHCGEALCCSGHHRGPHTHPAFEFLYLSRGRASWQAGGIISEQQMGDLYVAYPREAHGTGPARNPENQHLWLGVDLDRMGPAGAHLAARLRRERPRLLTGCDEMEPVLRGLVRQVVTPRARRAEAVAAGLRLFISLLEQRLDTLATDHAPTPHLPYSYAVEKAIAYMQQNLEKRLPLKDLAAVATARSVPYFCSLFRREVGVSPAAYHLQLRLTAAREVLRQPAYGITTAALQYGFNSSQHFSTQFRRAFGESPGAWRRKAR